MKKALGIGELVLLKMASSLLVQFKNMTRQDCIPALFLLLVASVGALEKTTPNDVRLHVMEDFSKGKFSSMNHSDVESLMSVVSKTMEKGRAFHYMWKLRAAMERETKILDLVEDYSHKDWVIQAFRPAAHDDDTMTFTNCAICNTSRQETRCNVTRVELLLPLHNKRHGNDTTQNWISVEISGQTVKNTRGTMKISNAVIFDLSPILLGSGRRPLGESLRVAIKKKQCRNAFPERSMIYEFCNINSTILERFSAFDQQSVDARPNSSTFEIWAQNKSAAVWSNKRTLNKTQENKMYERSQNTSEKESVSSQETHSSDIFDSDLRNVQTDTNTTFVDREVGRTIFGDIFELSANDRKKRSTDEEAETVLLSKDVRDKLSQSQTQHEQYSNNTRKSQKKKRHSNISVHKKDGASDAGLDVMSSECKRHPFYVSFQTHLNRWDILVPNSPVDIGVCGGTCRHANHFSHVSSELTAHAVIVNSVRGAPAPSITCSPHKMSSMSILKIDDLDMNFVVENLINARVDSCWCT